MTTLEARVEAVDVKGADRSGRRRSRRLSVLFSDMAADVGETIRVSDIVDRLGDRSFAALLVFFGALNMVPAPPGVSAVLGLPLLIVAAQLMVGSRRLWLPNFLASKVVGGQHVRTIVNAIVPRLETVERYIRPRYWPFRRRRGDVVVGALCFVLAIIVTMPVPFGNWLPACAATLMGMALSERDGAFFAVGCAVAIVALAVVAAVAGAAGLMVQAAYGWLF